MFSVLYVVVFGADTNNEMLGFDKIESTRIYSVYDGDKKKPVALTVWQNHAGR